MIINDEQIFSVTYFRRHFSRHFSLDLTLNRYVCLMEHQSMFSIMTSTTMDKIKCIYDDLKRWEAYLNHCWYAKINRKYDTFQLARQNFMDDIQDHYDRNVIDEFLRQQETFQDKLILFKRFPPERYFRKHVIDYDNLLGRLQAENVYILHLCEDWVQKDKKKYHKQLRFFEYLIINLQGHRPDDSDTKFIIMDYDLNNHLLKNSNAPDRCCIHHFRKNVFLSKDCYADFVRELGTIPSDAMNRMLYWNLNLRSREIYAWHQTFLEK